MKKKKKEDVPLRTAYSQVGRLWHTGNPIVLVSRQRNLRAQAQLSETVTKTFELVKREREKKRKGGTTEVREQALP
ncbi:hypothetical protein TNCV_1001021 [Trichonephila clavipes]|nr:hypothetical protein TNCV_1001021 [Trichonephila clavipes]